MYQKCTSQTHWHSCYGIMAFPAEHIILSDYEPPSVMQFFIFMENVSDMMRGIYFCPR